MIEKTILKQIIFSIAAILGVVIISLILVSFFKTGKKTVYATTTQISEPILKIKTQNKEKEEPLVIYVPQIDQERKRRLEEDKDQEVPKEELKKADVSGSLSKKAKYFIRVNYKANVVTIYSKDKNGEYTVPYKAMICSCGTYTPESGVYKTSDRYRWGKLIHNCYGQYATRIVNKILFHSVPYNTNKANDSLQFEEYDKLGTSASAGCVRLSVEDSKWIYDNCEKGTQVEFYASADPGPLGKPTAEKISDNLECRNWDPTDPAKGNPWVLYRERIKREEAKKEAEARQAEAMQDEAAQAEETEKVLQEINEEDVRVEIRIEKPKTQENLTNNETQTQNTINETTISNEINNELLLAG